MLRDLNWPWKHLEHGSRTIWEACPPDSSMRTGVVGSAPLGEDALAITRAAVSALQQLEE